MDLGDLGIVGSGIVNAGNAVTGIGRGAANAIADTAVSFGESVASYALVAGKEVASTGTTLGAGVFSFGNEIERFSVNAAGEVFTWSKTSAYDIEQWTESAAGTVASFSISAYENAVPVVGELWKAIMSLATKTLADLDEPTTTAEMIARVALGPASYVHEQAARGAGMTVSFTLSAEFGAVFGISYPVGLYVDSNGQWGFLKLVNWQQFKAMQTATLSQNVGFSFTVSVICVFGDRNRYSGTTYFDLGGDLDIGVFKVGAAILIKASNLSFLGFRMTTGIGISIGSGSDKTPQATLNGNSIDVTALLNLTGNNGPVYDAAARTAQNPGIGPHVLAAAVAATMGPFKPRFYGFVKTLETPAKTWCNSRNLIVEAVQQPMAGRMSTFRIVAGLTDPKSVSIEVLPSSGTGAAQYVTVYQDQVRIIGYTINPTIQKGATYRLERGLADERGVSFSTMETTKRYLVMGPTGEIIVELPNSSADFQRRATFLLESQPLPVNQTAVLRAGETLKPGEYRRCPDGRYFMKLVDTVIVCRCGSGPSDERSPPDDYTSSSGRGHLGCLSHVGTYDSTKPTRFTVPFVGAPFVYQSDDPNAAPNATQTRIRELKGIGTPGAMFIAVTDGGHICVFQGSPEHPRELVASSNHALITWANKRETVALRLPNGRFLRYQPMTLRGAGYLLADSQNFTAYETFELASLYNGRVGIRAFSGYYARTDNASPWKVAFYALISQAGVGEFFLEHLANGMATLRDPATNKLWRAETNGEIFANGETGDPQTQFQIVPVERTMSAELGHCFSIEAKHSGRLLTVIGGSKGAGARIVQQRASGSRNQTFSLTSTKAGLYSFSAQHSGLALSILGGNTNPGGLLVQETLVGASGMPAQTFKLLPNEDGTYCIVAAQSGLYLEVSAASHEDGAVIIQAAQTGADSQRFYIRGESSLPTRVLVAEPTLNDGLRLHYQERLRQTNWLDGFLDVGVMRFVGDFAKRGRAQLLSARRGSNGGVLMRLADLSGGKSPGTAVFPNQLAAEPGWFPGWFDEIDWQRSGNFLGANPPYHQLLLLNRGADGGRLCIMDLSSGVPTPKLLETWGASSTLDGWHDDNDLWLVGDFMNAQVDDVLCINRTPGQSGKLMVLGCSGNTAQVKAMIPWPEHTWLDSWITGDVRHFSGDFLGLGWSLWLMINMQTLQVLVVDLRNGVPSQLLSIDGAFLLRTLGLTERDDRIMVGNFLGRDRDALLCINSEPRDGQPKLAIIEVIDGDLVTRYRDEWSTRTGLHGLCEKTDSAYVGDFVGTDGKRAQLLVTNPNTQYDPSAPPIFGIAAAPHAIPIPTETGNRWQRFGEVYGVEAMAWHEGALYIVSGNHLHRRLSFAEGSGNAWAECGEAYGVVVMASHQGALYIVSANHLYRRVTIGACSGNAWVEAGEAWGVVAMASHKGALYIVSNNHLYRREAIGPGTGNSWTEAGEAYGVLGMTSHAGHLYILSNGRLYRRGAIGPGTGNDWSVAGTQDFYLCLTSSGQTIYGLDLDFFNSAVPMNIVALCGTGPIPQTGLNSWQRIGDAYGVVAMAWHDGALYIVSNNRLYKRLSFYEGSGNAWVDAGEAYGVVAMASHAGALYIVSSNHLYRRGALGPGTGNDWTEAGEAYNVVAMASHKGALYIVSSNRLYRRGAIGPGTGNAWFEAGEAWGVPSMTSHQDELYIISPQNRCLYRRGLLGPNTGNDWHDAGGAADVRHVASSQRTIYAVNNVDNGLYQLTQCREWVQ
jgi:hypothetical protein